LALPITALKYIFKNILSDDNLTMHLSFSKRFEAFRQRRIRNKQLRAVKRRFPNLYRSLGEGQQNALRKNQDPEAWERLEERVRSRIKPSREIEILSKWRNKKTSLTILRLAGDDAVLSVAASAIRQKKPIVLERLLGDIFSIRDRKWGVRSINADKIFKLASMITSDIRNVKGMGASTLYFGGIGIAAKGFDSALMLGAAAVSLFYFARSIIKLVERYFAQKKLDMKEEKAVEERPLREVTKIS
jgi:hypothetical protein